MNVKAGDLLFINSRWNGGRIERVIRITPSGRVVTKNRTYSKAGKLSGSSGHDAEWATVATPENIAGVKKHAHRVRSVERFKSWNKFSDDDLEVVLNLIGKYVLPGTTP
jgi:hypothetical protein